ncbi:MAG TPA: RNA polymerase sigma factor [Candidatus Polarisedimenticolia bacterium]|nr:RNA polymerase sigma factor [Candidatus Polarisedimenticolia bacterium]
MSRSPWVDETALIEEFVRGKSAAHETVDGWIDVVLRDEFRPLREEWADLKQEIRFRVYRNLSRGRFDGRSALRTYVHRIARNVCIDSTRLAYRHHESPPDSTSAPAAESRGGSGVSAWIARDMLSKVLEELPEGDRLLVLLVFGEHCSYAEVARRLGTSEAAVKTRMYRCKDRILRRYRDLG